MGSCTTEDKSIFKNLSPDLSGVGFNNQLNETPSFNILSYLYYYNGGGVGLGDINNDGLIDLFFTANQGSDKLYLNKGGLKFEDNTTSAGIGEDDGWSTGVTMADVNGDGLLDIYVCRLGNYLQYRDYNRLYINQGNGRFQEQSKKYGLNFSGFSTQAAFFDYDRDGDLDCYLLNHSVKRPEQFADASITRYRKDSLAGDMLLNNDNGKFIDVTEKSGIFSSEVGFGLGLSIADFNNDQWLDVYVGNDFHENDYLYLNNQDGTFTEAIRSSMGHTSNFTMGVDAGDINQDGLIDLVTLDMQPGDETIYKNSGGWENFEIYRFKRKFNYHHQSPKNAIQLNRGINERIPHFSEISGFTNLMATDWSWSPLIEDFDGDNDMDIFISNGIVRRPNDMDFVNFYANEFNNEGIDTLEFINKMPSGLVSNVLGINKGDGTFQKIETGLPGASTGAAYGDLDNDGDLDLVINNINDIATILINQSDPQYLTGIILKPLHLSIGAHVTIYGGVQNYTRFIEPVSGFQSMSDHRIILPVRTERIDSISISWPDGVNQMVRELSPGMNTIQYSKGLPESKEEKHIDSIKSLDFVHKDMTYNDQIRDFLQPVFCSTLGPKMAVESDKIHVTGGKGQDGVILNGEGEIIKKLNKGTIRDYVDENDSEWFDLEGDGDLDLYVATGGNELVENNPFLSDLIFVNEEDEYSISNILPAIYRNSAVVKSSDWDQDGDVDLFIGVNGITGSYGSSDVSYILVNNSGTLSPAPIDLNEMVHDAEWADIDNDGDEDLIVVGMWMPVTIFFNQEGRLGKYVIPDSEGWWLDVEISDVNEDGRLDILAGNFGVNHRFIVDADRPLKLYLYDFDNNGKVDPILTYIDSGREYIYPNLELLLKQLPGLKKNFVLNKEFAGKTVQEIFSKEELNKAKVKTSRTLYSTSFIQSSLTEWTAMHLPDVVQSFPVTAIHDLGNGEYVTGGNYHEVDPNLGKQDAGYLYRIQYNEGWQSPLILSLKQGQIRDIQYINDNLWVAFHSDTLRQIPGIPKK